MAALDLDEVTVPSCRLGQHLGGAAAELAVGRAVTTPGASGGSGARPATQRVGGGQRGRALVALAGDGGVGRACVAVAPGSVPFGEKGTVSCVRVRELPADLLRVQGAFDGVRSDALRFVAVDACLDARAVVVQSMAEQGSASLGRLASVNSPLLRQCQGGVALYSRQNRHLAAFAGEIWGFVFHRLASFSNPNFGLFIISRLRARGVGPVLTVTRTLIPCRRPSSTTWFMIFYYG